MGVRHSDEGKVGVRPFIRGKGDNWVEKGYTSPLNSPPRLKNQAVGDSGYSWST